MRNIMRKLFIGFYVFLLCIGQNAVNVKAIEGETTDFEVSLEIDESVGELTGLFDEIGRFSKDGIAKIGKLISSEVMTDEYGNEYNNDVWKYGLMNLEGEIVLEPIYDSIYDYDDKYFSIMKKDSEGSGQYHYMEGLALKSTGKIVLEPKYNWIPYFQDSKILNLGYFEEVVSGDTTINKWRNEIISNKDGVFSKVKLPNDIELNDYDYYSVFDQENLLFMNANSYTCDSNNRNCTYKQTSWIINEYGDAISDLHFDYSNGVVKVDNSYYVAYQSEVNRTLNKWSSGLLEVKIENGVQIVNPVITSEQGFNNIWIDKDLNRANYSKLIDNNYTWGYYDLIAKEFVDQSQINYSNNTKIELKGFDDIEAFQNCQTVNNIWSCTLSIKYLDGQAMELDLTYDGISQENNSYIVLYDWDSTSTKTNLIYKDANNKSRLLLENGVEGWLQILDSGFIMARSYKDNSNYLTLVSTIGNENNLLFSNAKDTWYYGINNMLIVDQKIEGSSNYYSKSSIIDKRTGEFILKDLYGLSIRNIPNTDTYFGVYSESIDAKQKPFLINSNQLIKYDFEANYISDFSVNGNATIYSNYEYSCLREKYNSVTQEIEYTNSTCYRSSISLMNSDGKILIKDVNQIKYYDDEKVAITTKSIYDEKTNINQILFSYVYLNNYVDGIQTPLMFKDYNIISFDQTTKISTLIDNTNKYLFVKDGVLFDAVNALIVNARQVGTFIDGILLIQELNSETQTNEIFGIDMFGNKKKIEGAISFFGRLVKIGSSYFYVSKVSGEMVELLPIDDTISVNFINLNHLSNNLYSHQNSGDSSYIFNLELTQTNDVTNLLVNYSDIDGTNNSVCYISKFEEIQGYVRFSKFDNNGCAYNSIGLMNPSGEIIIKPELNDFRIQNNFIFGFKVIDGKYKQTLYDLNGVNLLSNFSFEDVYFEGIDLQNLPFVVLNEDNKSYLLNFSQEIKTFLGNYTIRKTSSSGIYEYYDLKNRGLIRNTGKIILDLHEGYTGFEIIDSNQVIVAYKTKVDGSGIPSGMFDFDGKQLLSSEYSPVITENLIDNIRKLKINDEGFVEVIYNNPNIYTAYLLNVFENNVIVGEDWAFYNIGLINYFDLITKTLKYDDPILNQETLTKDGYILTNNLLRSNNTIDQAISKNMQYYFVDNEESQYLLDQTVSVYNKSKEIIIEAGKYNEVEWNESRSLVITRNRTCEQRKTNGSDSYSMFCQTKNGLVDKLGKVILEPIYDNIIFNETYKLYKFSSYDSNNRFEGYINEEGVILGQGDYSWGTSINEEYNWLLLKGRKKVVKDLERNESEIVYVNDIIDLKTNQMIFTDLRNFQDESIRKLKKNGYLEVNIVQDTGKIYENTYNDPDTGEKTTNKYIIPDTKNGIIDITGAYILEPKYDILEQIYYDSSYGNSSSKKLLGYYRIGIKGEIKNCIYAYYDEVHKLWYPYESECSNDDLGIFSVDKGILIEPKYSYVSQVNEDGYSVVHEAVDFVEKEETFEYEDGESVSFTTANFVRKVGFVDLINGELIIEPKYDYIQSNVSGRSGYMSESPLFDNNGLIKTINYYEFIYEDITGTIHLEGLANKNGVVLEPNYRKVYFKNGKYYAANVSGSWEVYNALDMSDKIVVSLPQEDVYIKSIEVLDNKKIISEIIISNGLEDYSEFGVLNEDMSEFLPFEFTSITYDGSLWYLEKYNPILGSYPRAVMDNDGNYVVPFSDKYDSLSEFVGGFAIGQSGTKEVIDPTSSIEIPSLLSAFFLDVNAKDDDFVLEVIDENGRVVGDLSNLYESATLLGEVDGVVKALVQKDGKFYIANLVKTPINVIKITGIEVSQTQINMIEGEKFQLSGTILPANHTENKSTVWSSSNEKVVVVDSNGMLIAVSAGTAVISYKVNTFQVFASVNVKKNSNLVVEIPNAEIQALKDNFVNVLNNEKSELDEFVEYYELLKAGDKDFVKYLSDEEKLIFENNIVKYFGDYINIDYVGDIKPQSLSGLILNLDLDKLFRKENINLTINVKRIDNTSEFEAYIKNNRLNPENGYLFEISIEDSEGNLMTEFNTPIRFTLSLPENLRGNGELLILQNHNGLIEEIDTTLGIDYTFSFTLDKLSTFMLLKSERLTTVGEDVSNQSNGLSWINYLLGIVGMLVLFGLGFILLRRKVHSI